MAQQKKKKEINKNKNIRFENVVWEMGKVCLYASIAF